MVLGVDNGEEAGGPLRFGSKRACRSPMVLANFGPYVLGTHVQSGKSPYLRRDIMGIKL